MKKKQKNPLILLSLMMAGGLAMAGCMDDNYDLSDIDGTIAVGSDEGITLPGNNSTTDITLSDLLDIDDSDCITTEDGTGDYVFFKKGDDVEPAHPFIERISVSEETSEDHPVTINVPTIDVSGLPDGTPLSGTAGQLEKAINTFDYEGDKPAEVIDLTEVSVEGTVELNITFNSDLQAYLDHFTSFDIEFPSYMSIENASKGTVDGNVIKFGEVATNQPLQFTASMTTLKFESIDDANKLVIEGGKIIMKGDVKVNATYPDLKKGNGDINNMQILGHTQISTITLTGAKGKFDPTITIDNSDINITDVPDFLDDDDVTISIYDPQITLNINSNVGIDALVDATLTAYFKDGSTKEVNVEDIRILGNASSKILICRQPKTEPYGDYTQVKVVSNLSELINKIPEKITFKATAGADKDKEGEFLLGYNDYNITTAYEFWAKLELEEGSTIVYNDNIDGWAEDLEDILLSDNAKIEVTLDVTNNVPAELDLAATPIDVNGNDLPESLLKVDNPATIGTGITKGVKITISQKNKDALKKLDGIRFRVEARSTGSTPLNESTQTIKIENITAKIVGKVVIEDNKD